MPTQEAPAYTATNVIVGAAALFTAPSGTAMPADTIAQNAIATPWVSVGATEEGVSLALARSLTDIRIEEQSTPVQRLVNETTVTITAALSEDTLASMQLAYGGGGTLTTAAPTTTNPGTTTLQLSSALPTLAAVFEATNTFGDWRRVYIPSVLSTAEVTTTYRRAANNRSYNLALSAICDPSLIVIRDMTAPHS